MNMKILLFLENTFCLSLKLFSLVPFPYFRITTIHISFKITLDHVICMLWGFIAGLFFFLWKLILLLRVILNYCRPVPRIVVAWEGMYFLFQILYIQDFSVLSHESKNGAKSNFEEHYSSSYEHNKTEPQMKPSTKEETKWSAKNKTKTRDKKQR